MTVFWHGDRNSSPLIPPVDGYQEGWGPLGCYADVSNGASPSRTLGIFNDANPSMTPGVCTYSCQMLKYALAGVENGES